MPNLSKPKKFIFNASQIASRGSNQAIMMNTLSTLFPEGERFFIEAVRYFRKAAKGNPDFDTDISRFIGQEAFHSIAHEELNNKFYRDGFADVTKTVRFFLGLVMKVSPKLAIHVTAILEHYTATLAQQVLAGEYKMTEEEQKIWYEHAREEWEHRKVSFDLMKLTSSPVIGKLLFPLVSLIFILTVAVMYVINGGRWDLKLFVSLGKNFPELIRFMKPGFAP